MLLTEFNNTRATFYFAKPKDLNLPKGALENKFLKQKKAFQFNCTAMCCKKRCFYSRKQKDIFLTTFLT